MCAWDDPAARDELVTGLVHDARAILDVVAGLTLDADQEALVGLLALVAGQDVSVSSCLCKRLGHGVRCGG